MDNCEIINCFHHTPYGMLWLGSCGDKLCLCSWTTNFQNNETNKRLHRYGMRFIDGLSPVVEKSIEQLDEYFAGKRKNFDIPLLMLGTDFQIKTWENMMKVPYGTTISYKELAKSVNRPQAVRAIGNNCHVNSIAIFIPCHRVIKSNGSLEGYAGGNAVKWQLLQLEGAM